MRVVFMGTSSFAVPVLEAIIKSRHKIKAVVTKPDRPAGRGLYTMASSVKGAALAHGLKILQPESLQDAEAKKAVLEASPEIVVVVAYGKILPSWVFDEVPLGAINVHGSLLPSYRGAAPIQRVIIDGQLETGVTIIQMDEGLDTGDILEQSKIAIGDEETAGELGTRMAGVGAALVLELLDRAEKGTVSGKRQPEEASYAAKIEKEAARIDFNKKPKEIHDLIRALNPYPGAYAMVNGKRLKVWRARVVEADKQGIPGMIAALDATGIDVMCGKGSLRLLEVQPENKKSMTAAEFAHGSRLRIGDMIE